MRNFSNGGTRSYLRSSTPASIRSPERSLTNCANTTTLPSSSRGSISSSLGLRLRSNESSIGLRTGQLDRDAIANSTCCDRVCEARELGLEAEVLADSAPVEECVERACALGVRAVRWRSTDG